MLPYLSFPPLARTLSTLAHENTVEKNWHCLLVNCLQEDISSFSRWQRRNVKCFTLQSCKAATMHLRACDPHNLAVGNLKNTYMFRQKQSKSTYDNQSHENEFTKATPPFPSGLCDNETQQREVLTFTS